MIAIIDYDAGNLASVSKALAYIGEEYTVTRDAEVILGADRVILPGVGAFGDAMEKLRGYQLENTIKEVVKKGIPLLGICLGMQILFERSDEAPGVKGLGLLEGGLSLLPHDSGLKIPQIGWNSIELNPNSRLFRGLANQSYVYFVHSYYLKAKNQAVVAATAKYAALIHAAVESGNIFGCQFHPEKSGEVGLQILKNFASI